MTKDLRQAALDAKVGRDEARAAQEAEKASRRANEGVARAKQSPLGQWFPDVEWEYLGDVSNGATLVRERGGLDLVLGARVTRDGSRDQGPDTWEVGIYQPTMPGIVEGHWARVEVLKEAADLGVYIDKHEPKAEPTPVPDAVDPVVADHPAPEPEGPAQLEDVKPPKPGKEPKGPKK